MASSLAILAPESRLVFVGNAGDSNYSVDLWPAMQSNQTLLGGFMGALFERPQIRSTFDELLVALENEGSLSLDDVTVRSERD